MKWVRGMLMLAVGLLLTGCGSAQQTQADFRTEAVSAATKARADTGLETDDVEIQCEGAYVNIDGSWVEKCSDSTFPAGAGLEIWMRLVTSGDVEVVTVSSDDACQAGPDWVVQMAKHYYGMC